MARSRAKAKAKSEDGRQREPADLERGYDGPLTLEEVSEGIRAAIENARDMVADAEVLADGDRYGRPVALCLAALEEVGKAKVLQAMATTAEDDQVSLKRLWRAYRSHREKSTRGYVTQYEDIVRQDPLAMLTAALAQLRLAGLAERARQGGIYVDYSRERRGWYTPREIGEAEYDTVHTVATRAVEHAVNLWEAGFWSVPVLTLMRETYSPSRQDLQARLERDVRSFAAEATARHRAFFKGLEDLGFGELGGVMRAVDEAEGRYRERRGDSPGGEDETPTNGRTR